MYDQYFLVTDLLLKYGFGISMFIICILSLIAISIILFWVYCVTHAYKYNKTKDRDFWLWILIISFFLTPLALIPPLIASLFYYLIHKNNFGKKDNSKK